MDAGTRLGPYEILSPLGAGGMGEVWKARDPRLGREVAVKILPPEVASDPSRLKRFEKEARSASALNHPNIVTIYDIGTTDSVSYIAMERVEGKTLRELLFGGALPIKRLLSIAAQIADGLARAHEAGIVHRDLKPENVMVTKDALVKILDFGLAKPTTPGSGSDKGSQLPTETGTSPGVVLGTVGYMSPEQAAAQPIDFRSDQFAFGSILYEMATGKRAFQKGTAVDTLSAILHEEPKSIAEINPLTPAPLRWIVERCLAKEREGRYLATGDLARDIAAVRDHLSEANISAAAQVPAGRSRRLRLFAGLRALIFAVGVAAALFVGRSLSHPVQLSFRRLTFRHGHIGNARFAPDGQTIVYSPSWEGGKRELYITRLESPESRPLGLPGNLLAISPLGEIAMTTGGGWGTLAVVPLGGGAPRELLEGVHEADWSPNGKSLAVIRGVGGKSRLEYPIGRVLYETPKRIDNLHVSRRGDLIAFREMSGEEHVGVDSGAVLLMDLKGKRRPLGIGTSEFAWSPDSRSLWFLNADSDLNQSELDSIDLQGRQKAIVRLPGFFQLDDVSRNGRLILERLEARGEIRCLPPGGEERSLSWLDFSWAEDLSADGKILLINERSRHSVYIRKTDGSPAVLLGQGKGLSLSPDGAWALLVQGGTPPHLVLVPTGAGESRVLKNETFGSFSMANWLPDGKRVLFSAMARGQRPRLYLMDIESERVRRLTPEGVRLFSVKAVSPDGGWFFADRGKDGWAIYSTEGGPDSKPRPIRGLAEGDAPIGWTADGGSLYVQDVHENPAGVYRVNLSTGKRELFREFKPLDPAGIQASIVHMTPDGKSWVYTYAYFLSDLYLVEGLK